LTEMDDSGIFRARLFTEILINEPDTLFLAAPWRRVVNPSAALDGCRLAT
jgi:hypothetical protein